MRSPGRDMRSGAKGQSEIPANYDFLPRVIKVLTHQILEVFIISLANFVSEWRETQTRFEVCQNLANHIAANGSWPERSH